MCISRAQSYHWNNASNLSLVGVNTETARRRDDQKEGKRTHPIRGVKVSIAEWKRGIGLRVPPLELRAHHQRWEERVDESGVLNM